MMKQLFLRTLPSLLLFLLHSSQTLAQAPAPAAPAPAAPTPNPPAPVAPAPSPPAPVAPAPAPPGPTNVTKILEKAGQFSIFIRLLKATQEADQLYSQLNDTNNAMTIFAPADNAFSRLKAGTLNQITDEEKTELVQFHVILTYLTASQFQTVSNPLRTQAGDSGPGKFPLNITTTGNSINITTGITNTSVSGTIYTDGQLAVYQVDQVLLPQGIFGPKPPAPAPAPAKSKKKKSSVADSPDDITPADNSSATAVIFTMQNVGFLGVLIAMVATFSL